MGYKRPTADTTKKKTTAKKKRPIPVDDSSTAARERMIDRFRHQAKRKRLDPK